MMKWEEIWKYKSEIINQKKKKKMKKKMKNCSHVRNLKLSPKSTVFSGVVEGDKA